MKKSELYRLFMVEDVFVFYIIALGSSLAKWTTGAGLCSIVVARPSCVCDWCNSGNVKSRHCDCQREIGPFVGMTYNSQPSFGIRSSCGNDE